jgi:hypothetical protein
VSPRYAPLWSSLAACGLLAAVVLHPQGARFPGAAAAAFAFAAVQLMFPAFRPRRDMLLCPLNWAVFLFLMQLIVLPATLILFGVGQGTLPFLPADRAINISMVLLGCAHVAFAVAYVMSAPRDTGRAGADASDDVAAEHAFSRRLIRWYIIIGVVGTFLTFRSPARLIAYFLNPAEAFLIATELAGTWSGLLGTVLRPFLQFAVVLAWCQWVDRRGAGSTFVERMLVTGAAIIGIVAVGMTFGYNRASFVYPLIALITVYSMRLRRISVPVMIAGTVGLLVPMLLLGIYRSSGVSLPELGVGLEVAGLLLRSVSILDQVQMYGQAPQFFGFLIEQADYGQVLHWGRTIISSILYPVPVIGEPFRATSGVEVYNTMIYGTGGDFDQVIAFVGELFLNLGLAGVLIGFAIVGILTARLQHAFQNTTTAAQSFFVMYAAIWLLFLLHGSIAVVSQLYVYFFWPIYAYYAMRMRTLARSAPMPDAPLQPAKS